MSAKGRRRLPVTGRSTAIVLDPFAAPVSASVRRATLAGPTTSSARQNSFQLLNDFLNKPTYCIMFNPTVHLSTDFDYCFFFFHLLRIYSLTPSMSSVLFLVVTNNYYYDLRTTFNILHFISYVFTFTLFILTTSSIALIFNIYVQSCPFNLYSGYIYSRTVVA